MSEPFEIEKERDERGTDPEYGRYGDWWVDTDEDPEWAPRDMWADS